MKFTVTHTNPKRFTVTEKIVTDPPFVTDAIFLAKHRSGLSIIDSIGGKNISITTPVLKDGQINGIKTRTQEHLFDGNSYTIYFKFKQLVSDVGTTRIVDFGNGLAVGRGFAIYNSNNVRILSSDGVNSDNTLMIADADATILPAGWIECFIEIDYSVTLGSRLRCGLYKHSDGSLLGIAANVNISAWTFNNNDNAGHLIIGNSISKYAYCDFKKFVGLKTIAQCRNSAYVTDVQMYYPTLYEKTDVSGNALHLTQISQDISLYYSNVSSYMLDYGYSLYRSILKDSNNSYLDICVPNNPAGVAIDRTATICNNLAGIGTYSKFSDHLGVPLKHNLCDSRLNIPLAQWDKSSTTIFENSVRASSHYDVTNPDEWYISELDYLLFSQQCKTSHKGLNFFKLSDNSLYNRKNLDSIFSYATNKSASEILDIITFTGDYRAIDVCIHLVCNASIDASLDFQIAGLLGTESLQFYWGDGTKRFIMVMDSTSKQTLKTYSGTSTYDIYIVNPQNLHTFNIYNNLSLLPYGNSISQFSKAVNLISFDFRNDVIQSGTLNGWNKGIKNLIILPTTSGGSVVHQVTGDMTPFIALEVINCDFLATGSLSGAVNMRSIDLEGDDTLDIDITNMPLIERLNSQWSVNCRLYGDFSNKIHFTYLCWGLQVYTHLTGDITNNVLTGNFDLKGLSVLTGDITGWTKLYLYVNSCVGVVLSGTISSPDLEIYVENTYTSSVVRPSTVVAFPKLGYFHNWNWGFTETEVNQILADIWANRNVARLFSVREIDLSTLLSHAPTGQGIVDKANLQTYRSPTPPGTDVLWTIDTN